MQLLLVLVSVPTSIADGMLHENDNDDVLADFFNGLLRLNPP
jgi:hypothetical protein